MNLDAEFAPEAYFDACAIFLDAPASVSPMTVIESHLFAFLGRVLALFRGQPIADWGYGFALTQEGFPFSAQFEVARRALVKNGYIEQDAQGLLSPNADLAAEINEISTLGSWSNRRELHRTATECALAMPMGSIRYAINRSPVISGAVALGQRRLLLEDDHIELLYEEYAVVRAALGDFGTEDLLSPAVLWLSARFLRAEA